MARGGSRRQRERQRQEATGREEEDDRGDARVGPDPARQSPLRRERPRLRGAVDISRAGGSVWCILVAAGRGERLGLDQPKAFARLGGEPLLAEPLRRLEESGWVDATVLVAPPGWEEPAILLAEELGCGKVHACVAGGATRTDSVRAGLAEVPEDALVVLVHDAARPLVPDEVIGRVLAPLAEGWDGAVPGLPVADTLKRAGDDGGIVETVPRDGLWAVQTPQAFAAGVLRRAYAGGVSATDCAALVEASGGRVKIVEGDLRLLKVTTALDLEKVASWL